MATLSKLVWLSSHLLIAQEYQFDHLPTWRFESVVYELIAERKAEIAESKEHWRGKIAETRKSHPDFFKELDAALETGTLTLIDEGKGAAYLLTDAQGAARFVIKPNDEAALCLHNPKAFASPFNERAYRVRTHIPLYRTAQTEALAYAVACELGLESITPQTHLAIISHPQFYGAEKEKLCSVQRYVPHSTTLASHPQRADEKLLFFTWCIGDTDAHLNNFTILESGAVVKIDNGLSFPDVNAHFYSALFSLSEMRLPARSIPVERILEKIRFFELETASQAFLERIEMISASSTGSKWR